MTGVVSLYSEQATVGLVLSGGGAMASYQAGVVKALSELDVRVHAVSGASAGALNGVVVAEADGDLEKAANDLEELWTGLIDNSPIEYRLGRSVLKLGVTHLQGWSNPLANAFLALALNRTGLLELALAETRALDEMVDQRMKRILRGEGLPLYVSILESKSILTDLSVIGRKIFDLRDTPPPEFRHIQSLPEDERKATILASAAIPIILQARRLGPDRRRFVDGVLGSLRTMEGNTPAEPLVRDAGCTHLIVSHSSDGSPWQRDRFPDTQIIEIRPGQSVGRSKGFMSETLDMFKFKKEIRSWIKQGYEDTVRCVGGVKRSLDLVDKSRKARVRRDRAVDSLDDDGFGSS